MRRLSDYKKPKLTEDVEIMRVERQAFGVRLPYDLATVLSTYDKKFVNLGCKGIRFDFARRSMKRVEKMSCERSLYTNDRNAFTGTIAGFPRLDDLELASHEKVDISILSHATLRELSLLNIDSVEKHGKVCLPSLKKLVVRNSTISFRALRAFLRLKSLADVEITSVDLTRNVGSDVLAKTFQFANSLRRLVVEDCGFDEHIYYPIASALTLNSFRFTVSKKFVSYDVTVKGNSGITFSNLDLQFYDYCCDDVQSVTCLDSSVDVDNLNRLNLKDLREFSIQNVKVDKNLVDGFLFRFSGIRKLSFQQCCIDNTLLYNILRRYGSTLRHLDVSGVVVPFDFLGMCERLLYRCRVVFGKESKHTDVGR